LTDWWIDRLIDWLIDLSTDRPTDWLTCFSHFSIVTYWLIYWLTYWLVGWVIAWLIAWRADESCWNRWLFYWFPRALLRDPSFQVSGAILHSYTVQSRTPLFWVI
jgi:hypothetical protein